MPDIKSGELDVSPDGPGGGGSGSGSGGGETPEGWTSTPCPGFCPVWPNKYIYLKIPGGLSYSCGGGPPQTIAATTTYLQLVRGTKPAWVVHGECPGFGWYGTSVTTAGTGSEGTATTKVFVCCNNEHMAFPKLWFYFENHIRPIGDPDPDEHACIEQACMTTIRCECLSSEDTGLPGFCHGTATLPNTDIALYQACDCILFVLSGSDEFEVKGYGFGACDCYGIPTSLPCDLQCANLAPPPAYVTVASGSIAYTEVDSIVFPELTGPHWEGTMNSTLGDGCYWNAAMFYNPVTNSMAWEFDGPHGVSCTPFCPPYSLVKSSSGSCDPFYIRACFDCPDPLPPGFTCCELAQAIFTIGTPP
jgi:hypothetical protein